MKTMKTSFVATAAMAALLMPWQGAHAWDDGGGHGGSGRNGGGYGYHGGYSGHGCRGCGAAIVGLALGTIVGAAIADAARPRVVVEERAPRPYYRERECRSISVDGTPYHNCGYRGRRDYYDDY